MYLYSELLYRYCLCIIIITVVSLHYSLLSHTFRSSALMLVH